MKTAWNIFLFALICVFLAAAGPAKAMDFHVTTPSEFQGALAAAGNNGGDDTIYLAQAPMRAISGSTPPRRTN